MQEEIIDYLQYIRNPSNHVTISSIKFFLKTNKYDITINGQIVNVNSNDLLESLKMNKNLKFLDILYKINAIMIFKLLPEIYFQGAKNTFDRCDFEVCFTLLSFYKNQELKIIKTLPENILKNGVAYRLYKEYSSVKIKSYLIQFLSNKVILKFLKNDKELDNIFLEKYITLQKYRELFRLGLDIKYYTCYKEDFILAKLIYKKYDQNKGYFDKTIYSFLKHGGENKKEYQIHVIYYHKFKKMKSRIERLEDIIERLKYIGD